MATACQAGAYKCKRRESSLVLQCSENGRYSLPGNGEEKTGPFKRALKSVLFIGQVESTS